MIERQVDREISAVLAQQLLRIKTTRHPQDELDYGSLDTVGLQLKLVGKTISDPDIRFGTYAGCVNGKWMVIRYVPPVGFNIDAIEIFDSEEEMKKRWRLD